MLVQQQLNTLKILQELHAAVCGRIVTDAQYRTSSPGVWAGGDCVGGKTDLTVQSVEDGKRAAQSIAEYLREKA